MKSLERAPSHWRRTTIGEVAEVGGGIQKQPSRRPHQNTAPFLRVANVQRGSLDLSDVHRIEVFDGELERFRLQRGDLLVVEGNGSIEHIGRSALWTGEIDDCVHQNHLIRVRPGADVLPEFLNHYWNSPAAVEVIREAAKTTSGLYTLSTGKVRSVPVVVPPVAEQRAIVQAIEWLLSKLDNSTNLISRVDGRVAAVRRAVANKLASAGTPGPLSDLLAEGLRNGKSVKDGNGTPVLRLTALRGGTIDLGEAKNGSWGDVDPSPYLVASDDFLVSRGNGTLALVGRGGLVPPSPSAVAYPDTMIRVRPDRDRIDPRFLRIVWDSDFVRRQIESRARTTAGIFKINQTILAELQVPCPPLDKQAELVTWADRLSTHADRLNVEITGLPRKASSLRRSILRSAFEGRLTGTATAARSGVGLEEAIA